MFVVYGTAGLIGLKSLWLQESLLPDHPVMGVQEMVMRLIFATYPTSASVIVPTETTGSKNIFVSLIRNIVNLNGSLPLVTESIVGTSHNITTAENNLEGVKSLLGSGESIADNIPGTIKGNNS